MIDRRIIEEIKSRIDIVEVIGDFVTLKKSGQSYKALSPFSTEKTPSFFVSPSKGIYKDFSSGKGGDAINFIMEHDGLSYIEAIKYLAKKYGIEVQEKDLTDEDIKEQNERESLFIVLNFANKWFINNLHETDEGRSVGLGYFRERGYKDETIKTFELGYSIEEWDAFYQEAKANKYSEDILEKAGLIIRKDRKTYDRFRGRVIFPIHNLSGKVIAFGGRTLKKDKNLPKYVNSPETEVYHKSSVLYGLHLSKKSIRDLNLCYLVEGYTDVISLYQAGIGNVVSSSGTALTKEQITLIKRYTENVTILYDGDSAGLKASLRGLDMLLEGGLNVRIVVLPDEDDPDSLVKKLGSNEMKEFLASDSRDFISFKTELYAQEFANNPVKKAEVIREIVVSITKIPDPVKRAVYIKETAKKLDLDESILVAEQNKILIRERRDKSKRLDSNQDVEPTQYPDIHNQDESISQDDKIRFQEREGIRLLITYGHSELEKEYKAYDYFLSELDEIEFKTPVYKEILDIYKEQLAKGNLIDMQYLMTNGNEEVQREVVDLTTLRYEVSPNWFGHKIPVPEESELLPNLFYHNILRLKFRLNGKLLRDKLKNLKDEPDPGKQENLQKDIARLKSAEREIGNLLGIVVND
jgi:DNA primase